MYVDIDESRKFGDTMRDLEIAFVITALRKSKTVKEAAYLLGIGRTTLVEKLKKYGIDKTYHLNLGLDEPGRSLPPVP